MLDVNVNGRVLNALHELLTCISVTPPTGTTPCFGLIIIPSIGAWFKTWLRIIKKLNT